MITKELALILVNNQKEKLKPTADGYVVKEDDVIEFSIELEAHYEKPSLFINDANLESTNQKNQDNGNIIYYWQPGRSEYDYEAYFANYFGLATLEVKAFNSSTHVEETILTVQIEVLAKKLNADNAEKMFNYLFNRSVSPYSIFGSATKKAAAMRDDEVIEKSLSEYIEAAKDARDLIEQYLPAIINKPLVRLKPKKNIQPFNEQLNINDVSMQWLSNNTDQLIADSSNTHSPDIFIDAQGYTINKIMVQQPKDSTDIPENRKLHGALRVIYNYVSKLIQSIQSELDGIKQKSSYRNTKKAEGYISFFSCKNRYVEKIIDDRICQCKNLQSQLEHFQFQFNKYLPVKFVDHNLMILPKASQHEGYRKIMMVAQRLENDFNWQLPSVLFSVKDIPTLYEIYCLCRLKEAVPKINDMEIAYNVQPESSVQQGLHTRYYWQDWKIDLYYQPQYFTKPYKKPCNIINSEAWQIQSGKIVERNSHREPDFVIEIENAISDEKFLIVLDAKYTYADNAFKHYLPELTIKYVHGLHFEKGGHSPVISLIILFPHGKSRNFNKNPQNTSSTMAIPQLSTLALSPDGETHEFAIEDKIINVLNYLQPKQIAIEKRRTQKALFLTRQVFV